MIALTPSRNVLTAFMLWGACSCASVADFYIGGSVGQAKSDDYEDYVAGNYDDGSLTAADFDDQDTFLRLFVGWDLNQTFALELGHVDLGSSTTDAVSNGCCFHAAGPVKHSLSADGLDLSVIGRLAVGDAGALNTRLGLLRWDVYERLSDSTGALAGREDGSDFFFAFGGQYRFAERFGLRGEYAMYKLDDFDFGVLSLSLTFMLGE